HYVRVGVLHEEPRVVSRLLADERLAGPAVLLDHALHPGAVLGVDRRERFDLFRGRLCPTLLDDLEAGVLVFLRAREDLVAELRLLHRGLRVVEGEKGKHEREKQGHEVTLMRPTGRWRVGAALRGGPAWRRGCVPCHGDNLPPGYPGRHGGRPL